MAVNKKVIVYSTPTCPWCVRAKSYLKEKGVEFEDIDVAVDQARAQEMKSKSGQMGVPVLDIGGKIIIGFDQGAIDAALK
ncbi:MAG: glutaredoxin domain-containing protein [Candidatus Micrarchaeota archaeon]